MERRKARRRTYPVNTKNDPQQNNELWTIDYKGHFPMGNGRRCHPLTICDSHSRYLLRIQGHYRETIRNVQTVLRQVLREYGQPTKLLSDKRRLLCQHPESVRVRDAVVLAHRPRHRTDLQRSGVSGAERTARADAPRSEEVLLQIPGQGSTRSESAAERICGLLQPPAAAR